MGRRILWILLRIALAVVALAFVAWASLALTIDGAGRGVAAGYVLASLALLVFMRPRCRGRLACAGLSALVLVWWLSIEPRNDRTWLADVSELPTMHVEGERLTVSNLRDFEYRSETDFAPSWEVRTYDLSRVTGVDLVVCDWGEAWIVHTILSWEFEGGEHLAVSIETRKEVGEAYSAVRGFFRQFELYYVVGDERDLIGVRTNFRGERVRLYRLKITPENARALLLDYAQRVNDLAQEPAWYNALTHNCTTSIRLHAVELGIEQPWNWRVLVNGYGEELLYMRAQVNTSLPFEELRVKSDITEAAMAAGAAPDFSTRIRVDLPARPTAP
jgi:hypothetical protein